MSPTTSHRLALSALAMSATVAALGAAPGASASWIAYRCGDDICRIDPDGSDQARLLDHAATGSGGAYSSPALSTDGSTIAYVQDRRAYVRRLDSAMTLGPFGIAISRVALAPDGTQIALATENGRLCVQRIDAATSSCALTGTIAATFDGGGGVIASTVDGTSEVTSDGAVQASAWTFGELRPIALDLSPNGNDLLGVATVTHPYLPGALWVAPRGRAAHQLPYWGAWRATWSPGGTRIAYATGDALAQRPASQPMIYLGAADGAEAHPLVAGDEPTWGGPVGADEDPSTTPADRTPPAISRIGLSRRAVTLRSNEAATATVRVHRYARPRSRRPTRHASRALTVRVQRAGTATRRFRHRLRPGRYRVAVRAVDAAGNRSGWHYRTVRVR
ncbi:TolB family protein [Patulibacter defluvii]|uniref:TolB family protein n=1 Tax=Patulibacter defluvii TaxID=3095358 RepID=UPI002A76578A|nr:hypothetical protein [Patulibacter sp. DM4]